jgi:hypothetical protein
MIILLFLCFHFISQDNLEINSFLLLFKNFFVTVGTWQLIPKCALWLGCLYINWRIPDVAGELLKNITKTVVDCMLGKHEIQI